MAYLDLSQDHLLPAQCASIVATPTRHAAGGLGRAERNVLFLSRRDTRASVAAAGTLARRVRRLVGLEGPNPLADPRLEALRRYAVLVRLEGARLPVDEEVRLRAAGFTSDDMAEVRGILGRGSRPDLPTARHRRLLASGMLALLTVQLVLYRYVAAYLDDGLLGLVGTAVATAAAVPPVRMIGNIVSLPGARSAASR